MDMFDDGLQESVGGLTRDDMRLTFGASLRATDASLGREFALPTIAPI
jgi:hypothetical protein